MNERSFKTIERSVDQIIDWLKDGLTNSKAIRSDDVSREQKHLSALRVSPILLGTSGQDSGSHSIDFEHSVATFWQGLRALPPDDDIVQNQRHPQLRVQIA